MILQSGKAELNAVAFIPARSGSKRVSNKNVRMLNGHPLIAYTIHAAIQSGAFSRVICATDSQEYSDIAKHYGADVPELRPYDISRDTSPDFEWVSWLQKLLEKDGATPDLFSILRPTSPFRTKGTINRAMDDFARVPGAHSLRAVERCNEHPGKMWVVKAETMSPLLPFSLAGVPWHSNQYAKLPEIYVQNASLEISVWSNVTQRRSISGDIVVPFFTSGLEGFDINNEEDWDRAVNFVSKGKVNLPSIDGLAI